MTALTQYQRLETFGIWHASPSEQRRDVVVQLGDATLTISDQRMQPLSHWSLPAVLRLNPGQLPAAFSPGPDMPEMLELEDETMVAALEKVLATLRRRRARPRRLRRRLLLGALGAALLGLVLWLPGALVRQAVAVVPMAKRAELGAALLAQIELSVGAPCDGLLGQRALDRLRLRLFPARRGSIAVLRDGIAGVQILPGGIILASRALIEAQDDPGLLAAALLAADEARLRADPLAALLREAGVLASLQLLTTGTLAPGYLQAHARTLLTGAPATPPPEALAARLAAAGVPAAPYAATLPQAAGDALLQHMPADAALRPVMPDGDWVSLQDICTG